MSKGKQAVAAAKRREREALEAQDRIKDELAEARERVVSLQRQLANEERLRKSAEKYRQQAIEQTRPELEKLRAELGALRDEHSGLELAHIATLRAAWKICENEIGMTSAEALEHVIRKSGLVEGHMNLTFVDHGQLVDNNSPLALRFREAIERSRGYRSRTGRISDPETDWENT